MDQNEKQLAMQKIKALLPYARAERDGSFVIAVKDLAIMLNKQQRVIFAKIMQESIDRLGIKL